MRGHKAIIIILVIFTFILGDRHYAQAASIKIGTTFSQVQCEYLGLDWREAYEKTLSLGFDIIRLGAYWKRIEKREGSYDFSELDWQIEKAKESGIKILLTVGMKAPRWPEYFIPDWVLSKVNLHSGREVSDKAFLRQRALEFIRQVIMRYRIEDSIIAWQVENEPLNRAGPKNLTIGEEFLKQEISLVKSLDSKARLIVVNAMTYPNKFLRFLNRLAYKNDPIKAAIDIADIPALNVYPTIGHKIFSKKICFLSNPKGRINYLKQFIARASSQEKKVWVTELQAEPWEPGELIHLGKGPPVTCEPGIVSVTLKELRSLGIDTVLLWGVEYWFYREKIHCDSSWLESVLNYSDARKPRSSQAGMNGFLGRSSDRVKRASELVQKRSPVIYHGESSLINT